MFLAKSAVCSRWYPKIPETSSLCWNSNQIRDCFSQVPTFADQMSNCTTLPCWLRWFLFPHYTFGWWNTWQKPLNNTIDLNSPFFPTCQVRVVRFYHSCSGSFLPSFLLHLLLVLLLLHHLCQNICQIDCQNICHIECHIECQNIREKECHIECQNICQIERQNIYQIKCWKICQIEYQNRCQIEC